MSRKRKRESSVEQDVSEKPIVEVERKNSEKVILALKKFFEEKRAQILKAFLFAGIALVAFFIGLSVFYMLKNRQGNEFFALMNEFEEIKTSTSEVAGDKKETSVQSDKNIKQVKYIELRKKADALCATFWATSPADNGCLLSAILSIQIDDKQHYLKKVKQYASAKGNSGYGAFYLFQSGQAYESNNQLDKAVATYSKLEETFKSIKKDDIGMFHKGRVLYLQGKLTDASKIFKEIIKSHPSSSYKDKAQKYLLLIEMVEVNRKQKDQ